MNTLNTDTGIVTAALPTDPDDGYIYTPPHKNMIMGSTLVITLHQRDLLIGSATTLSPVINASKKYTLTRVTTKKPLVKFEIIRVIATQYNFDKLQYRDVWGWFGLCSKDSEIILQDNVFKIIRAIPVGANVPDYHIYESIHLELIKGV